MPTVAPSSTPATAPASAASPELHQAFQDFVAGTFFQQMLKALRKTQGQAAYFHGGQAEQIFQGQFDQQIAEDLARDHGAAFAEPLFNSFAARF
ncbi:MAG TPA: rod-binding protein [Planctomycetaceae bacterium]|nr:rod-binding protein [Planctomycetaceae bacterium]